MDGDFRFPQKSPVVDCRIDLDDVDLGDIGRRFPVSGLPGGVFSGDITISGTLADVRHRIHLREDGGGVLEIDGSTGFDDTRGLWTDLSGSIRTLDLSELGIPLRHVSGVASSDFSLKGTDLQKPKAMDAGMSLVIRGISAAGIPLDIIRLNAGWSRGEAAIDPLEVVSGKDRLGLYGTIKPFERNSGLDLILHLEQPEVLLGRLSKHLPQIPAALTLKGGTDINAASSSWKGPFRGYAAHAELNTQKIDIKNNRLKELFLTADVTPDEAFLSASAYHENGSKFEIDGEVAPWTTPEKDITIGNLRMSTHSPWPESSIVNTEPVRFTLAGGNGIKVHACRLALNDTTIDIEGNLAASGEQDLKIAIDNLELRDIPGKWNDGARLSGSVSTKTNIRGTLDRPVISALIDAKNLVGYGIAQDSDLNAAVDYAAETVTLKATLMKEETPVFTAGGTAPVRFSLLPFSMSEVPGNLKATLETRNLRFSELPIPLAEGVEWDAVADMNLHASGTFRKPDFSGDIAIHDGYLTLSRNKLTYEQVGGKLLLSNNRLTVEELTIGGDREGRLTLSGIIDMDDREQFDTDLTVNGDHFYIPFQKAVSARISPKLHLTGGLDDPSLMGEVTITESKVNLDRLVERQYSDIQVVDTAPEGSDAPLVIDSEAHGPDFLSPLSADIISYLVFGRSSDNVGGNQAFNVEKAALSITGGLLAGELRNLLGDVFFIDSFAIDSGDSENGFGSVTLGKYITPEIFVSHRQGLTENDASYEEITYELTPQLKLEAQIGRDNTSSADLTWEFDF